MFTLISSRRGITVRRLLFVTCACLIVCARTQAEGQARIEGSPEVQAVKSSGSGTTLLNLRNDSTAPVSVVLSAEPATASGTAHTDGTHVLFGAENEAGPGESEYRFTLHAASTTKVKATVTGAWSSFPLAFDLLNGAVPIGKLLILPSPINVSLVEPADGNLVLNLVDGTPARIIVKNDDAAPYALAFRLVVDGQQLADKEFQILPQRTSVLEFVPTTTIAWKVWPRILEGMQEIFKSPATKTGTLFLYEKQGATIDYTSPIANIPLSASLAYFSPEWRATLNYLLIVFILILGGVASLTFGHSLPNLLERLNIVEQLNELARVTSNLSSNIESRLGVLVRLERSRLSELLKSRTTISPDFETTLTQCKAGVATLTSRVEFLQQLDVVTGRLHQLAHDGAPPSRIDDITESLGQACEILEKNSPADTDLQDVQRSIAGAVVSLDAINLPNSDFGKGLYQQVQDMLKTLPTAGTNATFDRIVTVVPGPLAVLKAVPASPTEVVPASYASVDMALHKIQIIRDYAVFAQGTTQPDIKSRLQGAEGQLISYLSVESWEALQAATLLLREMKDDLYPERIREALTSSPVGASIDMEPATAYEEEPLQFCVSFTNRFINTSSARQEWICTWDFGDGLQAKGWQVSHYFLLSKTGPFRRRERRTFEVSASFQDSMGYQLMQSGTNSPILVKRQIEVQPSRLRDWLGERTVAEIARLSVALLIAVFALVAGAKDQLAKLDVLPGLIAVFLAGYGVDVLKNLMNSNKTS